MKIILTVPGFFVCGRIRFFYGSYSQCFVQRIRVREMVISRTLIRYFMQRYYLKCPLELCKESFAACSGERFFGWRLCKKSFYGASRQIIF